MGGRGKQKESTSQQHQQQQQLPGSNAFGECKIAALSDLFIQLARTTKNHVDVDGCVDAIDITGNNNNSKPIKYDGNDDNIDAPYLNLNSIKLPDDETVQTLMKEIDIIGDGRLRLDCFLRASDRILGQALARILLVVGGPGSGKGALCA